MMILNPVVYEPQPNGVVVALISAGIFILLAFILRWIGKEKK
jgi:hypothetical protein